MNRTKTVIKNTVWELGYYCAVILLGFLAPRYIILIYGSEVNGLSSTITQILNIILILQAGATTAAIFSLYKPISENNIEEISKNVHSAEVFFKKISLIFAGIMLIVAIVTAMVINSDLDRIFVFAAFVIMGLKSFLDLYFTSKFRIVFTAYQEKFVVSIATLIEQFVYYALVFLTLYLRIHFIFIYIWLFAGCVVKVVFLEIKYRKKYGKIIPKYKGESQGKIQGRNYSLANEIAHSIVASSIAIILSFMYGLQETSVYSIYALVGQALNLIATALYSAFAPSFGNLIASNNKDNAKRVFEIFQYIYIMFNTIMFCCMMILVAPFVKIYTSGATDINYINRMLACLFGIQGICSAYRIPYNVIVSSCGYFKETWKQPVICIFLSIAISFIMGNFQYAFILWGPVVFYLVNFIYQHFKIKKLAPHLISNKVFIMFAISFVGVVISALICSILSLPDRIAVWILASFICVIAFILYVVISSMIFLPNEFNSSLKYAKRILRGRDSNA